MKWKRYSYWFILPYCSTAKFLTIRSHSPFNLIVQIYKCRLSILWMRWMCEDVVVDVLYILFVEIRWQSISIEWQNVLPALKLLHKLFIWSTFWKNDLLKKTFVVSKIGTMRFSMAHVRMNVAPCYKAYQSNFHPRAFSINKLLLY